MSGGRTLPMDLRLGSYQDVLDGETWDTLICDPPFSAKTHNGHNDGTSAANRLLDYQRRMRAKVERGETLTHHQADALRGGGLRQASRNGGKQRRTLDYAAWSPRDCHAFIRWAVPRSRGWIVIFTDDALWPVFARALRRAGRYVFAPVVMYEPGSRVRMTGDGPACWATWMVVARPKGKPYSTWGALPGGYASTSSKIARRDPRTHHPGGKPLPVLLDVVRDYSRPGDVVCDPCAGLATTLLAARQLSRGAIGSEVDPETHAKALARLAEPWSLDMVEAAAVGARWSAEDATKEAQAAAEAQREMFRDEDDDEVD